MAETKVKKQKNLNPAATTVRGITKDRKFFKNQTVGLMA